MNDERSTTRWPVVAVIRQLWRDFLSVYYANTRTWRWLKSGTLVVFGFFLWTGGAVLFAVRPEWGWLTFVMAYGFVLIIWGPLTHVGILPLVIRLRRKSTTSTGRTLLRHASKINLTTFLLIVIVVGTISPSVMLFEFGSNLGGPTNDVSGSLECDVGDDVIMCEIVDPAGFDRLVVLAGADTITTVSDPPYRVTIDRGDLVDTRVGHEFIVELRARDDTTLKRWIEVVQD